MYYLGINFPTSEGIVPLDPLLVELLIVKYIMESGTNEFLEKMYKECFGKLKIKYPL